MLCLAAAYRAAPPRIRGEGLAGWNIRGGTLELRINALTMKPRTPTTTSTPPNIKSLHAKSNANKRMQLFWGIAKFFINTDNPKITNTTNSNSY